MLWLMLNTPVSASPAQPTTSDLPRSGLPFARFVTLMALMTALTAMSIDIMLPALPEIGAELGLDAENQRQLVLTFYMMGFAPAHLVYGPLSDRYGRRGPLFFGLVLYAAASMLAFLAPDASVFLAARMLQGLGAAAPRVIANSIIRDLYMGRDMARVMSYVMMVFIAVPVLAPTFGEVILLAADWRAMFSVLLVISLAALVWSAVDLPETKNAADRMPLSVAGLRGAAHRFATTRQTIGYTIGLGFIFGVLMSYINSAQQVFVDLYDLGWRFPFVFGGIAAFMILASLTNAALVRRIGMRRVSHLALLAFLGICGVMAAAGYPGKPPLLVFCAFIASAFFCFGLIAPNFNALAMEKMGPIAGTASALLGFYSAAAGATFGSLIGQSFDGTVRPLAMGFTGLAVAALVTVLITERFRLAQPSPERAEAIRTP